MKILNLAELPINILMKIIESSPTGIVLTCKYFFAIWKCNVSVRANWTLKKYGSKEKALLFSIKISKDEKVTKNILSRFKFNKHWLNYSFLVWCRLDKRKINNLQRIDSKSIAVDENTSIFNEFLKTKKLDFSSNFTFFLKSLMFPSMQQNIFEFFEDEKIEQKLNLSSLNIFEFNIKTNGIFKKEVKKVEIFDPKPTSDLESFLNNFNSTLHLIKHRSFHNLDNQEQNENFLNFFSFNNQKYIPFGCVLLYCLAWRNDYENFGKVFNSLHSSYLDSKIFRFAFEICLELSRKNSFTKVEQIILERDWEPLELY
ncbi:hypothetical protein HK099_001089 [Clydaea vesicula]|uniref:Uncharacterized protein n=1 Tax=Clydaea vesicula TaxID=447962 RepID=A0AAD5TTZ8_9FUNG|nr:hypothetical protein HK099_001089 [Clydaea vesicula]